MFLHLPRPAVVLLAFSVATPSETWAQTAPADRGSALTGTYAVQADAQEQLRAAVERAVAPLNFVVRPVARRRLLSLNQPSPRVEIVVRGDSVVLRYAGQPELRASRDGTARPWQNKAGETLSVEVRAPAQSADTTPLLRERYTAEDGTRENRWFLDPATGRARLEISVSSPRLPAPLRLELTYTRVPTTAGSQ